MGILLLVVPRPRRTISNIVLFVFYGRTKEQVMMKVKNNLAWTFFTIFVYLVANASGFEYSFFNETNSTYGNSSSTIFEGTLCSPESINATNHSANEPLTIELGEEAIFQFDLPRSSQYLECFVFRPNETYSYNITQTNSTNNTNTEHCISFFSNHYLQHNKNEQRKRTSARMGEIQIRRHLNTSMGNDHYECHVNISNVNEEDNGKWKAVMTAKLLGQRQGHKKEIHEYSQVINVKVHGNWSEIPGYCPECGPGNKTTEKFCNNPEPQHGGDPCDCDKATFAIAGNFCNDTYANITEICSEWTDCTTPQPTTTSAPESGTTKLHATEPPVKDPKIWIWIVIVVLILCILAVIGVWLYLKKKKSGGNGGGGQKYDDVPQDAK